MDTGDAADDGEGRIEAPAGLVVRRYGDAVSFLDALSDALDRPRFAQRSAAVLSMPPGERFTGSHAVYADLLGTGTPDPDGLPDGMAERLEGGGSRAGLSRLFGLLHGQVDGLRDLALDRAAANRAFDDKYLLFALYLDRTATLLLDVMGDPVGEARDDGYYARVSELAALLAHLVLIAAGEKRELDHEFVMDVARAGHHARKRRGEGSGPAPDDREFGAVTDDLLREAAVLAFDRGGASAERGAELARMPVGEFEAVLAENGIRPDGG